MRGLAVGVALLAPACSGPQAEYTERVEVREAELVIVFHDDAVDGDVDASIALVTEIVGEAEPLRLQWRDTEEVALDPELLSRVYGDDTDAHDEVGEALLIDLPGDRSDEWLVATGDVMARQRGVLDVSISGPDRRLDPLCYWGGDDDLVVWLAEDASAAPESFSDEHLAGFAVEVIDRDTAFAQMLVLLEYQPRLVEGLTAAAMPVGLIVDVGADPIFSELATIRDVLGSLDEVSSVVVRPPATVRTVCPG